MWDSSTRGYRSSRKISDKCAKVYNDAVFGGVAWSKDERYAVFVGEKPESASFKNYWEDAKEAEEKKDEGDKKEEGDKKKEETPVTYLDEKYKYIDDFGETLVGKKRPALFLFDVVENTFNEVQGLPAENFFPTFPVFD